MNGRFYRCARCVGLIFLLLPAFAAAQGPDYDFVISGAHLVDGTGAPWVEGDIAIAGDRIVAIGDLSKAGHVTDSGRVTGNPDIDWKTNYRP